MTAGEFRLIDGPEYAYVQVANWIESRIGDGTLAPGARLPGERALAEEYGVALGTVRSALRVLRDKHLITTTASKGTFILAAQARELPDTGRNCCPAGARRVTPHPAATQRNVLLP